LLAGKGEQSGGKIGRPARSLGRVIEALGDLRVLVAFKTPARDIERAHDDRQHIVEVVRDAAGQLTDRFHLLHLPQLSLCRCVFANLGLKRSRTLDDAQLELFVHALQRRLALAANFMSALHYVDHGNDRSRGEREDEQRHPFVWPGWP